MLNEIVSTIASLAFIATANDGLSHPSTRGEPMGNSSQRRIPPVDQALILRPSGS